MPEEDRSFDAEREHRSYTLWDLAFAAVVVAALLASMMLWAIRTMS